MFTGLIEDLGTVVALAREGDGEPGDGEPGDAERGDGGRGDGGRGEGAGATLRIATRLAGQLREGDSIAVDGVCLTASAIDAEGFAAQAMAETLRRSSLGALRVGDPVNLELALPADGRLGGHIVQGHVDATALVAGTREEGFSRVLDIALQDGSEGLGRYLVAKGSVTVNGVSLTVSALREGGFSVALIPETLARTNLGRLAAGDRVNLEADILAKHVERLMEART
jgi:riboflavin synthase